LSLSARALNLSLGTFSTGVAWQRYLALPDGIIAAADRPAGDSERRPDFDPEELRQILERFDRVSSDQEYRSIASLPEFQETYDYLSELVDSPPQAPPPQRTALAEELPSPELQTR
jgi:hypothetical protein